MRTTIDLPEHLLFESKKLAAERKVSLTRLIEESVRSYLSDQRMRTANPAGKLPILKEPALRPGIDLTDTSKLWELE